MPGSLPARSWGRSGRLPRRHSRLSCRHPTPRCQTGDKTMETKQGRQQPVAQQAVQDQKAGAGSFAAESARTFPRAHLLGDSDSELQGEPQDMRLAVPTTAPVHQGPWGSWKEGPPQAAAHPSVCLSGAPGHTAQGTAGPGLRCMPKPACTTTVPTPRPASGRPPKPPPSAPEPCGPPAAQTRSAETSLPPSSS